jgi:hypothetical protein
MPRARSQARSDSYSGSLLRSLLEPSICPAVAVTSTVTHDRRLPFDFKALIRRLTVGGHERQHKEATARSVLAPPDPGLVAKAIYE